MKKIWLLPLPALILAACISMPADDDPRVFRVTSYNIGDAVGSRPSTGAVAATLDDMPWADIYVLQEVLSRADLDDLSGRLENASGRRYFETYSERLNIAIIATSALQAPHVLLPDGGCPVCGALGATARIAGLPVAVVGVHLDPIPKRRDAEGTVRMGFWRTLGVLLREMMGRTPRSKSVRELITWLPSIEGEEVVVAGDFNTVPGSRAISLMSRRLVDVHDEQGHYLSGTYRRIGGPIKPRVDYIFASDSLKVLDAEVLRRTPGDHYPVTARLALPRGSGG